MENKFSICIPNFNYQDYIGITLESVLNQQYQNFELLIADNHSTDNSIEIIKQYANKFQQYHYKINKTNLGFAGNLDEVAKMAKEDWIIMLSSDDVMQNDALVEYNKFVDCIPENEQFAFCSAFEKIDGNGQFIEYLNAHKSILWLHTDIDPELTLKMGFDVYKVPSGIMLERCLNRFYSPFNFASTCFKKDTYEKVGGYSGSRMYNPDKWFNWKLLAETDFVYFLDKPLFQYRWHNTNQAAGQLATGDLKYWVDEYRNCFECNHQMRKKANLEQEEIQNYFITHALKYSIRKIAVGDKQMAKRVYNFAKACYPQNVKKNKYNKYNWIGLVLFPLSKYLLKKVIK